MEFNDTDAARARERGAGTRSSRVATPPPPPRVETGSSAVTGDTTDFVVRTSSRNSSNNASFNEAWDMFGRKMPKAEIVYFCQVLLIFTIVLACIINLSLGSSSEMWVILLSTCAGAILPSPTIKGMKKKGAIEPNLSVVT